MHIKLDTGMSRLGFGINEQSVETIKPVSYTHLDVYKRQEQYSVIITNT